MPKKYDIDKDVDTIKRFGYKPSRKTYEGKNPAGIPVYKRSITRYTSNEIKGFPHEIKTSRSVRHAGSEGQDIRGMEITSISGPIVDKYKKTRTFQGTLLNTIKKKMLKK